MAPKTPPKATCQVSGSPVLESQMETPIGVLVVRSCGQGLHSITYPHKVDSDLKPSEGNNAEGQVTVNWLRSYFTNAKGDKTESTTTRLPTFCFPPDESTEFERNVWKILFEKTKIGETLSYGELANLVGNPKAARAVGSAMKKNPIPIIIPCHRVTRANGDVGNYAGGSNIKEFLLQHEQGQRAEL